MMSIDNATGLRSNRGIKDYLLRELFRSMLRSRCSIPIEKFLPMLLNDYPASEELLLTDFERPEVPPVRPNRPEQPNEARPECPQRPARGASRPRGDETPRRPNPKAQPKQRSASSQRGYAVARQLADIARRADITPRSEIEAQEIDINLTGGLQTPADEQQNFIAQIFSQLLGEHSMGGGR